MLELPSHRPQSYFMACDDTKKVVGEADAGDGTGWPEREELAGLLGEGEWVDGDEAVVLE